MNSIKNQLYFKYSKLNDTSDSIRVCTIQPGSFEQTIKCDISQVTLADARGKYQALSYAWGSDYAPRWIRLNGTPFRVQESLFAALKAMRNPAHEERIWADVICINQGDESEKSHQISIMDQIYKSARGVLVWIGPSDPLSEVAFDYIHRLELSNSESPPATVCEAVVASVERICSRPYWSRAWIVQEILLGRRINILCGRRKCRWFGFSDLVARVIQKEENGHIMDAGFAHVICDLRAKYSRSQGFETIPIQTLLHEFQGLKCFAIQDRIFSLIGIATELHGLGHILVNYSTDLGRLFLAVMRISEPKNPARLAYLLQTTLGIMSIDTIELRLAASVCSHFEQFGDTPTPVSGTKQIHYLDLLANSFLSGIKEADRNTVVAKASNDLTNKLSLHGGIYRNTKRKWETFEDFCRVCASMSSRLNTEFDVMYIVEEADLGIAFRPTAFGLEFEGFFLPDYNRLGEEWFSLDDSRVEWQPVPILPISAFGEWHKVSPAERIKKSRVSLATDLSLRSDPRMIKLMAIVLANVLRYLAIGSHAFLQNDDRLYIFLLAYPHDEKWFEANGFGALLEFLKCAAQASVEKNEEDDDGCPRWKYCRPPVRNMSEEYKEKSWSFLRPFLPKVWLSNPITLAAFIACVKEHLGAPLDVVSCTEMIESGLQLSFNGPLGQCKKGKNGSYILCSQANARSHRRFKHRRGRS